MVVAIGASAGGLDALERFFDFVPDDSGAAYVVIQHLDPNFRSMMDELLARHSRLPIRNVKAGMELESNAIYLNPARQDMTVESGRFQLHPSERTRGLNLPINCFFSSVAAEYNERVVGVILSGTGSDGTKGCEAIKLARGRVFVQDPATAKFDSMPASVLAKNLADGSDAPENLPALILQHLGVHSKRTSTIVEADPYSVLFAIIKARYDIDFSTYKQATIERRTRRRMGLVGCDGLTDYVDLLAVDRDEVVNLTNDLLVDVTAFFRDREAFDALFERIIQPLVTGMGEDREVRVWVAGCSSGEEAYSIAIQFAECAAALGKPPRVKILATDIHTASLGTASAGLYPASAVAHLPAELVVRYFESEGDKVRIRKSIRKLVVFSQHNVLKDPPFSRIDLIACRNVLIYFGEDAQKRALNLFHFSLVKGGAIFLGPSESLGEVAREFKAVSQKWRIFSKTRDIRLLPINAFALGGGHSTAVAFGNQFEPNRHALASSPKDSSRATFSALKELLARYAPPGFLIARDGTLLHIFGDASNYIVLRPGVFSRKITDMLPGELAVLVANGLGKNVGERFQKFRRSIRRPTEDGEKLEIVSIEPLAETEGPTDYLLMTIEPGEVTPKSLDAAVPEAATSAEENLELRLRNRELAEDLQSSEENLQSAIEELATSNEELQSTNEELMASNEELQSTNEELHSVNEELYSVTAEHQRKIDELMQMTLDMEHLLKATQIGTIFLDETNRIRRFTPAAAKAFNLIPHDIGRPMTHITMRFDDLDFHALLDHVTRTRETCTKEVTVDGRAYLLRILTYQVDDEDARGSVVTLVDVDQLRRARAQVRELDHRQRTILGSMQDSIVSWDARTNRVTFCNEVFASIFNATPSALVERDIFDVVSAHSRDLVPEYALAMEKASKEGKYEKLLRHVSPRGDELWLAVIVSRVDDEGGAHIAYVASGRDLSERVRYVAALQDFMSIKDKFELSLEEGLQAALEIGRTFLGFKCALFAEAVGDRHRVVSVAGSLERPLESGTMILLPLNSCSRGCKATKFGACGIKPAGEYSWPALDPTVDATFAHLSGSEFCEFVLHDTHSEKRDVGDTSDQKGALGAYISMPVHAYEELYGAISFFSDRPPEFGLFAEIQRGFIKQIAQWIGLKVEADRARQALVRNEGELRLIFDNVPQSIWHVDSSSTVLRANRAAAEMWTKTPEKLVGASIGEVWPNQDLHSKKLNEEVLESGDGVYGVVAQQVGADGATRWTSTDRIPYFDPLNGKRSMLIVATDITQLKARENELEQANKRLAAANDGLKKFAHVASHDLQEPLRKISMFGRILLEEHSKDLNEDSRHCLQVMAEASVRMRELVQNILAFSHAANAEIDAHDVHLDQVLRDMLNELDSLISSAGAVVDFAHLPVVRGDPTGIQQLFRNLVSNAIKYRRSDAEPRVTITAERKASGDCVIAIRDNGRGIDTPEQSLVFLPFTRLQPRSKVEGSGLGLAICKSVCDRHGWSLSLESKLAEGSTFFIVIPRRDIAAV